jgi:DNA/RNA-binding domain of Phe-tRNA-synthetase-like protein
MKKLITISSELKERVKVALLLFRGLNCQKFNPDLWADIQKIVDEYQSKFREPAEATPILKPARDLYRAIGMEPTRKRPSSEALLRRILHRKELYQINSLVDASNYCSLKFLLPIGLYDFKKITGQIELRRGKEGEEYQGIRKDMIHVKDRFTLADDLGPFGNPSADSLRTAVNLETESILFVIFAPVSYPQETLNTYNEIAVKSILSHHTGELVINAVVS